MSSDSEEDFQSADEGVDSDLDSREEKESTSQVPIPSSVTEKKSVTSLSKEESHHGSNSIEQTDSVENISSDVLPTVKNPADSIEISQTSVDNLAVSLDGIEVATSSASVISDENQKKAEESVLPNRTESITFPVESKNKDDSACDKSDSGSSAESSSVVDDSITKPISESQNVVEELHSPQLSSASNSDAESLKNKSDQNESLQDASQDSRTERKAGVTSSVGTTTANDGCSSDHGAPQAKKVSKIGLKKPREKLGERLGSKKLGQKISKPLEGISCDSLSQDVKSEEKDQTSTSQKNSPSSVSDDREISQEADTGWGGGWGGWGSTLINAASTLTQEVGRGVGSVVELVEEGIGVPSPEDLAKEQLERERMLKLWDDWGDKPTQEELQEVAQPATTATTTTTTEAATSKEDSGSKSSFGGLGFGGLTSLVSGVSGALESAGSKVVYGGLDTLELIGRRTMDVLHDSDPGLRAKRDRFLERVNKPNLSAVLREAREQAVANTPPDPNSASNTDVTSSSRVSFSCLWLNSTGPAHLEALALIARQCTANTRDVLANLPSDAREQVHETNSKIMALSEIEEENLTESSIFAERVSATIRDLHLPLNAGNIAQCWSDLTTISEQYSEGSVSLLEAVASVEAGGNTVETNVIGGCVALVERLVAVAHKAAELSLISGDDQDPLTLAANFRELVVLGGSQLEGCADVVCAGLSSTPQQEQLTPVITNIYMQVCEGSSCLQQSLVHLCTTLQLVVAQRAAADQL